MKRSKNNSVWIIRTSVAGSIEKIIRVHRSSEKLTFELPQKKEIKKETPALIAKAILEPIDTHSLHSEWMKKDLTDLFKKAESGDWVLIAHHPNTINAVGIIQKQKTKGALFQIRDNKLELSVRWYFTKEVKLSSKDALHYEKIIIRYSSPAKCFEIFQHIVPLLPKEILKNNSIEIPAKITLQKVGQVSTKLLPVKPKLKKCGTIYNKLTIGTTPAYKLKRIQKESETHMTRAIPPLQEPGGIVELFYATNRGNSGNEKPNEFYTDEYVDTEYGICHVNIPKKHEVGEIERPTWWKLQFSESPERDVMLLDLHEVSKDEFASTLAVRINEKDKKEALLFVHGYNNDFKQTAWRTGQIVFDLAFTGVSAFYSWPSAGDTLGYIHDLQIAQLCKPKLKEFTKLLLGIPGVEKLHIIAHSMGTYILTGALDLLAGDAEIENKMKLLHQIILCAPDIDQKEFKEQIYPKFKTIGDQRTIYASSNDKALKASDVIREGMPRLGEGGENLFVENEIDTVDASNVSTDLLGHGYFAQTKELINDIFHIVKNESTPEQRNLKKRNTKDQLIYWLFPE